MGEDRSSLFQTGTLPEWIGVVGAALGVLWLAVNFKSTIEADIAALRSDQRAIVQKLDSESRIAKLEQAAALNDFSTRLASVEALLDAQTANMNRVWPRLRAHDTNVRKIEQAFNQAHPEIRLGLVDPQEF